MKRVTICSVVAAGMLLLPVTTARAEIGSSAGGDKSDTTRAGVDLDSIEQAEPTSVSAGSRTAKDKLIGLGADDAEAVYLVRLADPAVPTYEGGITGLPATKPTSGDQLEATSPRVVTYERYLEQEQAAFVDRAEATVDRPLDVVFEYRFAANGLAIRMTGAEALALADDPEVIAIQLDFERELQTDQGPDLIEAPAVWNAMADLGLPADYKGEGIIIGTIDTGISPNNPSFADVGDDGYDHANPWGTGVYVGVCDPSDTYYDAAFPCNDKLIGAWVFDPGITGNDLAVDYDGHGSHTASTSGGNVVDDVTVVAPTMTTPPFDISGVAPHANVISYLGCCSLSGLTMSIDQAIADGVDVINYSIGSSAPSALWDDFDTVGFLNARAAGIFVATSNGNDGPGFATTGSPADAPWITSVGASTHARLNHNAVTSMTGGDTTPPADIDGKSVTAALGLTDMVYAGSAPYNDPLCLESSAHDFTGLIVMCDRGENGRVEKSENVAAQGAAGFVLANDSVNGDSLSGDAFAVPGVHIGYDDGQVLQSWLATGSGHQAAIQGTQFQIADVNADIMAGFSSRGPNRAIDVIVPDVTAPGVDILAAEVDTDVPYGGSVFGFISGTSMASPHVAGAGALMAQARPGWSPAQMQSALMTTAYTGVLDSDGVTPADPYAQGAGRINVADAIFAGLLFDETAGDYEAANPTEGGDPKTLNLPSFANSQCLAECAWTRTATVPASAPDDVTWTTSYSADMELTLDIQLSAATVDTGDTMTITVNADVAGAPEGDTLFGRITLTPSEPTVPSVTMPVAVVPSAAVLPDAEVEIETRRSTGSEVVSDIQSYEVTDFQGTVAWVEGTPTEGALVEDSTNGDPYDDLGQVDVYNVAVPAGTARLVAEIVAAEMPDLDLFVGTGSTPSEATEVCASATGANLEYCNIDAPAEGDWWILVQNWEGTSSTDPDAYTMLEALVPFAANGTGSVDGPAGTVPGGDPYDVTVSWNLDDFEQGDVAYGAATMGTSAGSPDDIGTFPLRLERVADDVTKVASSAWAAPGDTIDYEITVQPNVRDVDLTYTITDTVPDGLTIDEGTVTGELDGMPITGIVNGQTIEWTVTMPTSAGATGSYVTSTPATSAQCADWAGYLDLGPLGISFSSIDGDTVAVNAFSSIGPFEFYGESYPGLEVGEDGFAAVTGGYGGDPYFPQAIPDAAAPNGVIAPLWADLEVSVADGSGVRLATAGDVAVIQWENAFEYTDDDSVGPAVGNFQAWIYNAVSDSRPEMTFEYESAGALPTVATIGVENLPGDLATAIVSEDDPASAVTAGGTYCLDYEGPTFPAASLTYSVGVDGDTPLGVLTNTVEHVTDNPYDEVATTTTDLAVVDGPVVAVDPSEVDFGGVVVGDSATDTVTVTNDGDFELTVSGVSTAAPFSVDAEDCTAAPVAPAESCEIDVSFEPAAAGAATGELEIESDAASTPDTVGLSGTGLVPVVAVDPSEVDFGGVVVGDTATDTVTVTNDGGSDLTVSGVSTAAPFSVDAEDCTAAPVAPAESCEIDVSFEPVAAGAATGELEIESDAASSRDVVDLAGNGITPDEPGVTIDPSEVDFGEVVVGEEATDTVTVTNDGTSDLDVSGVAVTSLSMVPTEAVEVDVFSADGTDCTAAPIAPGDSCDVVVTFAPGSAGAASAVLEITSDASSSPDTVDLSGMGVEPEAPDVISPIDPSRYWDTREAPNETFDGQFEHTGRMDPGETFAIQIAGRGDVPVGATSVVANLTAIYPTEPGFATMFPCAGVVPLASHINYGPGEVVANNAVVPLSADGELCVYTLEGVDFALDVNGYSGDGSPLAGITPARYLDTREPPNDTTFDGESNGGGPVPAGDIVEVQIGGRGDVPDDATSALVNLTAVAPEADGYFTLYPCTDEVPDASTVNYFAGDFVPNGAVAPLSDDGTVCIYTLSTTQILLDVTGYVPNDAEGLTTFNPARLLDTRPGEVTVDGEFLGGGRVPADGMIEVQVTGRAGIPADATAALLNIGVVYPDGPGFATLYPCGDRPNASNVNHDAGGVVVANNAITKLSADGTVCIYVLSGTDLILDVSGYLG